MTPTERLRLFHQCCESIVGAREEKAVNYAVNRALMGLNETDPANVRERVLYIIGNITHWRGDVAKQTRADLKSLIA